MSTQTPEVDEDLERAVRTTGRIRAAFYVVVLLVALGGQASGAVETLGIEWYIALPVVAALELGGMVWLRNAEVRRRLGEHATVSRIGSAAIAIGAAVWCWESHADHKLGGFFAGMSLLGYATYLMSSENKRRDRLRKLRQLPPTPPAFGVLRWLRNPAMIQRAKNLALADPELGLYGSLAAAREELRVERQHAALAKVLGDRIRKTAGREMADIAVTSYDLSAVAARVAARADYDGLATLIAADLTAEKLAGKTAPQTPPQVPADDLMAVAEVTAPTLDETVERVVTRHLAEVELPQVEPRIRPVKPRGILRLPRPRRMGRPAPRIEVVLPAAPEAPKPRNSAPRKAAPGRPSAAKKVADAAAKLGPVPAAVVAKKAGVHEDTARKHLATINGSAV